MQKTTVDQKTCIGCGLCVATCPKSYILRDDFLSEALPQQEDEDHLLQTSLEECPVGAIHTISSTDE